MANKKGKRNLMASGIKVRIEEVLQECDYTDPLKMAYESGISYGTCYTLIKKGNEIQRIDLLTLGRLCSITHRPVKDFLQFNNNNGH